MTINFQTSPYLPRQRNFPSRTTEELAIEIDKTYIDLATSINSRTIGLYSVNRPSITGDVWYIQGQPKRQQSLRQVYVFTSTASIVHGIDFTGIGSFTKLYGTYTDGTNIYGLIGASNVAIAGQISFYLTPTNIVFLSGAGAPTLTNGNLVLEWLSVPQNNNP